MAPLCSQLAVTVPCSACTKGQLVGIPHSLRGQKGDVAACGEFGLPSPLDHCALPQSQNACGENREPPRDDQGLALGNGGEVRAHRVGGEL